MEGITPEQLAAIQQQCIFCQIATGKVASKKVYEDEHVIAVLDINPANPGHLLIITKKHYFVMPQIPDDEVEHVGKIAKQLSQVLLKALHIEGTTVFIANGVAAGQKAQHFMMHIIPRKDGDKVGIEMQQKQISDEDYDKIHQALLQGVKKSLGEIAGLEQEGEELEEIEAEAEEKTEDAEIVEEESTQEKQSFSEPQKQEVSAEPKIIADKRKKSKKKKIAESIEEKKEGKKKEEPEEPEDDENDDEGASLDDIAKILGA